MNFSSLSKRSNRAKAAVNTSISTDTNVDTKNCTNIGTNKDNDIEFCETRKL